ncbi:MAG: methyltransferase domain-containing protein [Acidobacteria bacterium]|nr:methyltransferase domain-containing protein [Acidobacteriota bacterium]
MARVSVFTPTNNPTHLAEAYQSLKQQSFTDWQWLLVTNGGLKRSDLPAFNDSRVVMCDAPEEAEGRVGALKKFACGLASGKYLVELDHDDQLLPEALAKVKAAFDENPDVGMVFSNCGYVQQDNSAFPFRADYGWQYRERRVFGFRVMETLSPAPIPQHLCKILFAPDHLRAYRKSVYTALGGHDESLQFADDHDLTCRMYLHSKIHHIDDLLYLYRVHGENNWLKNGELIEQLQWQVYERYAEPMARRWAYELGLLKIDLCSGASQPEGYLTIDRHGADIECDLNARWPFDDNSVGVIRAVDAIEHLSDPVHVFNEAHRVLEHGGFFLIEVPSTDGRGWAQDPTHRSFYNSNSFWYYTKQSHQQFVPEIKARFQALQIKNYFPNQFCEFHNIVYTRAHLLAVKDGQRFHGEYGF